jgi:hypothetical protein
MQIWIKGYRPFILGGDVHAPFMTDWPMNGPFDGGRGIELYTGTSPGGKDFVCEGETGGVVGRTLDEVRRDILDADPDVLTKQLAWARMRVSNAIMLDPEDFFRAFDKRKFAHDDPPRQPALPERGEHIDL